MRLWKWPLILFLLGSLCLAAAYGAAAEQRAVSGKLIRLHVVANSDDPADQAVKLRVRDRILRILREQNWGSREEAASWLSAHGSDLEAAAAEELPAGQTARATLREERFPTRDYDTFSLPAGPYLSLRVRIGRGEGRNWWCVVYPALCAASAGELEETARAAGLDGGEIRLIAGDAPQTRIKFKLLEWIYGTE